MVGKNSLQNVPVREADKYLRYLGLAKGTRTPTDTSFPGLSHITSFRYAAVLIGRITGLARSSVCLSVPYGLLTRIQKKLRQTKIGVNAPQK